MDFTELPELRMERTMRDRMIYLIVVVAALTCLMYPSASEGQEYEFVEQWPEGGTEVEDSFRNSSRWLRERICGGETPNPEV